MTLIPLEDGGGATTTLPELKLSPAAAALAAIRTAPVRRVTATHALRLIGRLAFDETRLASITSWTPGRIERLYVDSTGIAVKKGQHLLDLYSPSLYAAQQELLQAIRTAGDLASSPLQLLREASSETVVSAREKLRQLGLTVEQVEEVVKRGTAEDTLVITAPISGIVIRKNLVEGHYVKEGTEVYAIADLSHLWLLLDAYEQNLPWLRYGQEVEFEVEGLPGKRFVGRIALIDPVLEDRTRSVKVRVEVENPDGLLRPNMYAHAIVHAQLGSAAVALDPPLEGQWTCPMHPEIVASKPGKCPKCGMDLIPAAEMEAGAARGQEAGKLLLIPETAPLITGTRAVVYVRLPDRDGFVFQGREIVLGPRAEQGWVVRSGLEEGEEVVVNGAFKIDSELQIRAQPSMMAPASSEEETQTKAQGGETPEGPTSVSAPASFQERLGTLGDRYLEIEKGLSEDGLAPAKDAAQAFLDELEDIPMEGLVAEAHEIWMDEIPQLRAGGTAIREAGDLEQARKAFGPFSKALIHAMQTLGYRREGAPLGVFHCPMANADWLQLGSDVRNPYYGSAMLDCGSLVRELPEAGAQQ